MNILVEFLLLGLKLEELLEAFSLVCSPGSFVITLSKTAL